MKEYSTLNVNRASDLQDLLNAGAKDGWELVPGGIAVLGSRILAIMERYIPDPEVVASEVEITLAKVQVEERNMVLPS